jgi:hypothetical protein
MSALKKGITTVGAVVVIGSALGHAAHPPPSTVTPAGRQHEYERQYGTSAQRQAEAQRLKGAKLQEAIQADKVRAAEIRRRKEAARLIRGLLRWRVP